MAKCSICGKEIKFIKGYGGKSLVVDKAPEFFVPDNRGTDSFIHEGVMRRGTRAQDGLLGYRFHECVF